MKLYELAPQFRMILESADEETGELSEESLRKLTEVEAGINEKVEACCMAFKNLTASADAVKAEGDMFLKRARTLYRNAEMLKKYILENLKTAGLAEAGGSLLKAKISKTPGSIKVENPKLVKEQAEIALMSLASSATKLVPVDEDGKTYEIVLPDTPWKAIVALSSSRAKELNDIPLGAELVQGETIRFGVGK